MKRTGQRQPLTDEQKAAILEYYLTNKNNTRPDLAKRFNVSEYQVGKIIDDYFNNLRKWI